MGDLLKSNPIFAKLGFDESNQWILYMEGMQNFFIWMANNITEKNILTDAELRLEEELKASGEWYNDEELEKRFAILEAQHPGILTYTEKDLMKKREEVQMLKEMEQEYAELDAGIDKTKANLSKEISDLEMELHREENRLEQATNIALEKAKELEALQIENAELTEEMRNCFLEPQSPPVFMHEMPLEEYFSKLDLFQQQLNMYINANIKIKTSPDSGDSEENDQIVDDLKDLERQLYTAELKLIETKARNAGLQEMIDELDISKFQDLTPNQMKTEIAELDESNKHLESKIEALMSELKSILQEQAQHKIENILMENTKIKYERASKRLDVVKNLERMVTETLDNAELLWILMQLDLEKIKEFCEIPPTSSNDVVACNRRIETMLQQKSNPIDNQDVFVERLADLLSTHLKIDKPATADECFKEYEKFCRNSDNTLKAIVEKKYYSSANKAMEKLKSAEKIYSEYVFDGPTDAPMFDNVKFIEPIYDAIRGKEVIEKEIRRIRSDVQTNITDKMKNDRFWRYQQLLWIWFLTEPKKLIQAIEEVKKAAASKGPTMKMLAGIKRKDNEV